MNKFRVIIKNVHDDSQKVVVAEVHNEREAQRIMACMRKAKWVVNRRPNLDTIDHIGLTFERIPE